MSLIDTIRLPAMGAVTVDGVADGYEAFALAALAVSVALGWLGAGWVETVMWLVAALLAYTLVNRVRQGLKEQQSLPSA